MRNGQDIVRAGDFDQLITIQENADDGQQNPDNGEPLEYRPTTFAQAWARVGQLRGRELVASGTEVSEDFTVFDILYISPMPTTKMRVLWEADLYDIRYVNHVSGGRQMIELTCRKVV